MRERIFHVKGDFVELTTVQKISNIDDAKRARKLIAWSFIKACFIVLVCVLSDFNKVVLSVIGIYHLFKIYMLHSEIKIIRQYLSAFYTDISTENATPRHI